MDYASLATEGRNEKSMDIDKMNSLEIARLINDEDKTVPYAVEKALPEIAATIDICAQALQSGGRIFYVGAGTSGRLGVVDASECPPTYGVSYETIQGIMAGGEKAVFRAVENAEDSLVSVTTQMQERGFTGKDICIGISASGSAPCVCGALEYARSLGAKTVSIACNAEPKSAEFADISIVAVVGPEVVSGSTRMKSGTAQKLILNTISTGVMVRTGRVIGNLLAFMRPSNKKLLDRAARIVCTRTGCEYDDAVEAVKAKNGDIAAAIKAMSEVK